MTTGDLDVAYVATGDLDVVDVATAEPEVADEVLRTSFPGLELDLDPDAPPFRFTHRRVSDGLFAVNRLSLTGRAHGRGEFPEVVAAGHVRRGRYVLDYGSSSIDTSWPYLRPPGQQQARFEDVSLELLTVDPTHFATQAAVHLAGTGAVLRPVAAERTRPISQEAASLWHSTADHVATAAADLTLFELPLVRATLLDLCVMTLLRAFPLASDPDFMTGIDAHPRALRRALQYMEDHVGDPITVPMIADAARLSVRSLQNGFTRHLGTTPMRHLRRLRLHAAHDQLIAADPDGGPTVEHIARRWGFTHLGRFAGAYREAFGTLPSIDLRR